MELVRRRVGRVARLAADVRVVPRRNPLPSRFVRTTVIRRCERGVVGVLLVGQTGSASPRPGWVRRRSRSRSRFPDRACGGAAVADGEDRNGSAATTVALAAVDLTCSPFVVSDASGSVLARSRIVYPSGLELPSCPYGLRLFSFVSHWPAAEAVSRPRTWPSWATTTRRSRSEPRSRPRTRARPTSPSRARAAATSRRPSSSARRRKEALPGRGVLHPYRFSRALYYREAFDLAERESPCCSSTRR